MAEHIFKESEIRNILHCLPEKFIVDFANGIDVSRDHINVQSRRQGLFKRMYDGFSGQGSARHEAINQSLVDGVEGALIWLTEITSSLAQSNLAIVRVNEHIGQLQSNVAKLAVYSADTRQQLERIAADLSGRCDRMTLEIVRIDAEARAVRHIEFVFNKWKSARYSGFNVAGRLYAALEELRWGDFGDYYRSRSNSQLRLKIVEDLINRAVIQLSSDMAINPYDRRASTVWLAVPSNAPPIANEALAYMGDWAVADYHPFVVAVTQTEAPALP
ncbi:MAG: hypothetical protein IPI79_06955 [Moraxellaceae bacterium]|nr:hypothetical protein [Moraxellaceae bacterium]